MMLGSKEPEAIAAISRDESILASESEVNFSNANCQRSNLK
jgi:hypothetical protein